MSPDLKDLLDDAARAPRRNLDVDDIHRRGRRGRAAERVAGAVAVVALVGGAAAGIARLVDVPNGGPVIQDPVSSADPTEGAAGVNDLAVLDPVELGVDVLVVDGREVVAHRADGSTYRFGEDATPDLIWRFVSDGRGGFVHHVSAGPGERAEIVHVDVNGDQRTLLVAGDATVDAYALVGEGDGGPLVVDRSTPSVSLLELDIDTGETRIIRDDIATWPEEVYDAASLEVAAYIVRSTTTTQLVVDRPDADPTVAWEVDREDGDAITDVVSSADGRLYVLVGGLGSAYVLELDLFENPGALRHRITVPLDAGTTADDIRATELSVAGGWLAVNRAPGADAEVSALLLDTSTVTADGRGTWSTLEPSGRALLAQPAPDATTEPAPACVEDESLRDAEPTGEGIHLYATCSGDLDVGHAYRLDLVQPATGDVVTDANIALDTLFGVLPAEHRGRGYTGLTLDIYPDDSGLTDPSIAGVTFENGLLTVDFNAPDGFGNFSTSAGSSTWHSLLAANLLQFDGVDSLELRADGTCEGYSGSFESEGCIRLTEAEGAPWNLSASRTDR